MSSTQVVAAFFIVAGEEVGARVLGSLDRGEVVTVGRTITELRVVPHQTAVAALEMVRARIESAGPTWIEAEWPTLEACSVWWVRRDGLSG